MDKVTLSSSARGLLIRIGGTLEQLVLEHAIAARQSSSAPKGEFERREIAHALQHVVRDDTILIERLEQLLHEGSFERRAA